jgi:NAD(P)-dependent dehydrogenase (short-subunit alcohol dehydrogenase family)
LNIGPALGDSRTKNEPVPKVFDLTGKTALVTGGGTGLGYHMTRALARSGATVLIASRRAEVLREAAGRLNAECRGGGEVRWHPVDLNDRSGVRGLAEHALLTLGRVDIYIGNAGQDINEHISNVKDTSIDQLMQVNISANVELVRALLPGMKARRWGRVMFSSSVSTVVTSDAGSYITGTNLVIDGGMSIMLRPNGMVDSTAQRHSGIAA